MRYLIVYLLRKEAANYQKRLSDELADVFNFEPVSKKIDPHITLKAPFEASDSQIEKLGFVLERFASTRQAPAIALQGFGSFDRRVLYIDVKSTPEADQLAASIITELKKLPWVGFSKTDIHKHLHATLAYADDRRLLDDMTRYVSPEKPRFDVLIDNIAILRRGRDRWDLHKEYALALPETKTDPQPS